MKCVEVSGTVQSFSKESRFILLDTMPYDRGQGVTLKFQPDRISDLSNLQVGQSIVVRGQCCDGYGSEVGKFYVIFRFASVVR